MIAFVGIMTTREMKINKINNCKFFMLKSFVSGFYIKQIDYYLHVFLVIKWFYILSKLILFLKYHVRVKLTFCFLFVWSIFKFWDNNFEFLQFHQSNLRLVLNISKHSVLMKGDKFHHSSLFDKEKVFPFCPCVF